LFIERFSVYFNCHGNSSIVGDNKFLSHSFLIREVFEQQNYYLV
jgi:hypothetical protein